MGYAAACRLVCAALAAALATAGSARAEAPDLRATQLATATGLGAGSANQLVVTVAYDSNEQFLPVPAFRVTLRVTRNDYDQFYHETVTMTGPQLDQTPPSGVFTATFGTVAFPEAGTYQVRVYVDDTNIVSETDELNTGGQPGGGGAGLYGSVNTDSNNYLSYNCLPNAAGNGGCTTLPVLLNPIPGRVIGRQPEPACEGPYHVVAPDGRCVWSCGQGTQPDTASGTCVCQPRLSPAGRDRFGRLMCQ